MARNILLLEPNYANKYPPIGLMKIATYHKRMGDNVVFYKGNLKQFIIEQIADKCIKKLTEIDDTIDWYIRKDIIVDFIRTRKREYLVALQLDKSELEIVLTQWLINYKDYYWRREYERNPDWDRVFVTTLFTFYWNITIETINFAKTLVKPDGLLMVGGVLASIQTEELRNATGIEPYKGILNTPGQLDEGNLDIIDNLPLDYSILDEIEYKYPMTNAFYGYTTRGCIRKCSFCAVPILEPNYIPYIPLKERIEEVRKIYGDQKDLLLMDNNILASDDLPEIIQNIIDCGFSKGAKYTQVDHLAIAIRNLKEGVNDRAYIRKTQSLLFSFYKKLKDKEESYEVYKIFKQYHILKLLTSKKENLLQAYEEIKDIYRKHYKASSKLRFVDFNQGVDARLFNEEKVELLGKINIRPLRIAFDNIRNHEEYDRAIRMSKNVGIKDFSNYLLYNYNDKPIDLYERLKINIELCEELSINIYSFPMKYHPIFGEYSHNRDYIGKHWNRKYIRAVQAILNSTKGKIGRGKTFFHKAFGKTEKEFLELLEMPETFILYRYFFEWLEEIGHEASTQNWRDCWSGCKQDLDEKDWQYTLSIIHNNNFGTTPIENSHPQIARLLNFYTNYRKDIITPDTELYNLKQEYDKNPTYKLRKNKK
ncbi:MAG: hypothetical protein LUG18_07240 [Candidatus Azobacteroides sp.]|nr:hypothetical protein [Candidatus Azobacteroides sp.]